MPALGTHAMINDEERIKMYGDIPKANFYIINGNQIL